MVLARQILGPLLGEVSFEQSRGLADLDQVAVGVTHVAANLGAAIDRGRHELGPFRSPLLVARLDVRYAQVHEGRDRVVELVVHDRDVRLVGGGGTARVHDHPRVGELDHAWVLLKNYLAAQNLQEALARRGQVIEVDVRRSLGHRCLLAGAASAVVSFGPNPTRGQCSVLATAAFAFARLEKGSLYSY